MQVRRIWEALLMKQKAFQKEPGQFPLRGLVARRLVGRFSDTEQQAVSKQIFDFGDGGHTFCMRKVRALLWCGEARLQEAVIGSSLQL